MEKCLICSKNSLGEKYCFKCANTASKAIDQLSINLNTDWQKVVDLICYFFKEEKSK